MGPPYPHILFLYSFLDTYLYSLWYHEIHQVQDIR